MAGNNAQCATCDSHSQLFTKRWGRGVELLKDVFKKMLHSQCRYAYVNVHSYRHTDIHKHTLIFVANFRFLNAIFMTLSHSSYRLE